MFISAKKTKEGKNQRLLLFSTNSTSSTMLRIPCKVEETGNMIIAPERLTSMLSNRAPSETVSFAADASGNRFTVKAGSARSKISSAASLVGIFETHLALFPHQSQVKFSIGSNQLKSLLDRTAEFTYKGDGNNAFKVLRLRSTEKGYQALATNAKVVAMADVEDTQSPGLEAPIEVEIPNNALDSLIRVLSRNKNQKMDCIVTGADANNPTNIFFRTEDVFFGTRLLSAHLPNIDDIFNLSKVSSTVQLARPLFLASLQRSNPFCSESREDGRLVSIEVKPQILTLSAKDSLGEFVEEIPTQSSEGEKTETFPVSYFSQVLNKATSDSVTMRLGVTGPKDRPVAIVLDGGANGATYVVGAIG
jgi:DNA polymerase III sliding clamp (beta) subunit (PCNA family)